MITNIIDNILSHINNQAIENKAKVAPLSLENKETNCYL